MLLSVLIEFESSSPICFELNEIREPFLSGFEFVLPFFFFYLFYLRSNFFMSELSASSESVMIDSVTFLPISMRVDCS